jgi:hypothetical protein
MNKDKGVGDSSSSSSSSSCDDKPIYRAASLDSAEAALSAVAAPPMLQRQTYHSPPGAFAMSTTSTFGAGGIVRRSRTYSDETDRSTQSTRDLVAESPPLHRVPVAELVQPTSEVSSSSLSLDPQDVVNNMNRQRIWDLEVAQEVYGGVVAKANDNEASPGPRRVWARAFFLACVMVFLLLAAVATTRSLEKRRKGPVVPLKSGNNPTGSSASSQSDSMFNHSKLWQEAEDEEHHEESLEAKLIAETVNGTFISCPNQNTSSVSEDLRLAICDVADVWEDELERSSLQNNESSIDLTTLWPVACHANATMLVCTTIRDLICTSLQTGLLPTDPWNHSKTTGTAASSSRTSTLGDDCSLVVPRTVTNTPTTLSSSSSSSSDHGSI